jgi:hypothetical protein
MERFLFLARMRASLCAQDCAIRRQGMFGAPWTRPRQKSNMRPGKGNSGLRNIAACN